MAKKPLRSQLNQIRAWVRQGRTDAWIAHQLDISASELREFRRRHGLTPDGEDAGEVDLRDEIEAEIEAATLAAEEEEEELDEEPEAADEAEAEVAEPAGETEPAGTAEPSGAAAAGGEGAEPSASSEGEGGTETVELRARSRRRRRRRRGGRGRGDRTHQGTFDHGDTDGYGLWLDPAVTDDPVYAENWKGHRAVEVQIEPDRIVIRRADSG